MDRHHGVYVYLKHSETLLPSDEPAKVRIYAEHSNVKYVFGGPEELNLNPRLFTEANYLREVSAFGSGLEAVRLYEFAPEKDAIRSR